MNKMFKGSYAALSRRFAIVGTLGTLALSSAHAAIDTTDTMADITAGETAVLAIGAAIVALFLGIFLYKLIRRVF